MFASIPTMLDMATVVECEGGVRLSAAPANLGTPDLRQILSPRLTNSQNMEVCSPSLGFSSPSLDRAREILVAQEDARKQKKIANNARRELQRTQKELSDAHAQVLYLEQKCRGYEAENAALKDQLATAVSRIDLEAAEIERDMYQEQEQEALNELEESRKKEQDTLKQLNDERQARLQAEKDCAKAKKDLQNLEKERSATSTKRNDFKREWNVIRVERDSILERYRVSQRNLDQQEMASDLLRAQLKQQENRSDNLEARLQQNQARLGDLEARLQHSAEAFKQQMNAARAHVQREHHTVIAHVQRKHQHEIATHTELVAILRRSIHDNEQKHNAWVQAYGTLEQQSRAIEQRNRQLESYLRMGNNAMPSTNAIQPSPAYYENLSSVSGPAANFDFGPMQFSA